MWSLLAQVQHLQRKLQDSDAFSVCFSVRSTEPSRPERGPHWQPWLCFINNGSDHDTASAFPARRGARNARLIRSATVSVVSANVNVSYLGYICSGLARALRDPYHSGLSSPCAESRGTERSLLLLLSLTVIFCARKSQGFSSSRAFSRRIHCSDFGNVRSAAEGKEAVGWVELVEREKEREGRTEGGGRCIRTAHPGHITRTRIITTDQMISHLRSERET